MIRYIDEHKDKLFPSEIAYNLHELYRVTFTPDGIRKRIQKMKQAPQYK